MKKPPLPSRRLMLASGASLLLSGCGRIGSDARTQRVFDFVNHMSYRAQRLLAGADKLAPEYREADITRVFKPNGSIDPKDPAYRKMAKAGFADYALAVDGLVEAPGRFTLAALRALPSRTHITRHDCVEGWSCIGKWKGVPLAAILDNVRPKPEARYVVFHCADNLDTDQTMDVGGGDDDDEPPASHSLGPPAKFYGSIDMLDARHPQTILAYDMNDKPLPVEHGAPLRLRLERQLGYKMSKYVMRLELVARFDAIGGGKGGYWEDLGYDWYAGV